MTASVMDETLDYFLAGVLSQDTKRRLEVGDELVSYLRNKQTSLYCEEMDKLADGLANWVNSSNFKVSLVGLEVLSCLIDRMGSHFKPYVTSVLAATIDRLGDSKDQVRESARDVLLKLMLPASTPQYVAERYNIALTHRLAKVRDESLVCLQTALNQFGAKSLMLSKLVPQIVKMLDDQNAPVREQAMTTLVEIYRHVGERFRVDVSKKDINTAKLNTLLSRMDDVKSAGLVHVAECDTGDDEADGSRLSVTSKPTKRSSSSTRLSSMTSKSSSATGAAGAVDEETFVRSFEDVGKIYIGSVKDVTERMTRVRETLSDVGADWEKRADAMKELRALLLAGAAEYADFQQLLRTLEPCLRLSVQDLRSQVVREACITVAFLAQQLGKEFDRVAEAVLPSLIQLIPNSVKIMSTSGTTTVGFIVRNTPSSRLIPLITSNITSKSAVIRRQCSEFIALLLQTWPTSVLERQNSALYEAIKKGISDADPDARVNSRRAFWGFDGHFREQANQLFSSLDSGQQKQVQSARQTQQQQQLGQQLGQPSAKNTSRLRSMSTDRGSLSTHSRMMLTGASSRVQAAGSKASRVSRDPTEGLSCDDSMVRSQRPVSRPKLSSDSSYGTLPRQPKTLTDSASDVPSTPERQQRSRTSQSQPGSRTGSPSSRSQPAIVPTASRLNSRVQQTANRNASPTRLYGRDKRSVGAAQRAGRVSLSQSQVTADEVQSALATALLQSVHGQTAADNDDAASDSSSLCSESSYRSDGILSDPAVDEVLSNLSSGSWSDRRDGLVALQTVLQSHHRLSRSDAKKLTDVLTRLFNDPHLKVLTVFLDALIHIVTTHSAELTDWLPVMLPRLLTKSGSDTVVSLHSKILRAFEVIRDAFPREQQFNIVSKYIVDQTQTASVKVKVSVLNYLDGLCQLMDPAELTNTSDTRLAITRIITWTTDPKSVDMRKAAQAVLIALFTLNTPLFSVMLRTIPKMFQDGATRILQGQLQVSAGDMTEPLSAHNVTGIVRRHSLSANTHGVTDTENLNPNDIVDSCRKMSANIESLSVDRQKMYNPNHYQDDVKSTLEVERANNTRLGVDTDIFNEEYVADGSDVASIDAVISELSNHNTRVTERKHALTQLIRLTRDCDADVISQHFKTILLLLLETLADVNDDIRAMALRVLREMVRCQPDAFHSYAELTILKLLEAHKDPVKEVNRAAEECATTLARAIPAEQCVSILNPFIETHDFPFNLAAIKMQIKVIESAQDKDIVRSLLPTLIPRLLKGYDSSESSVRKAAVFCLVAVYLVVGEELRPHLAPLSASKLKLLNLYIKRAVAQKNNESSDDSSKASSPVSVVENTGLGLGLGL